MAITAKEGPGRHAHRLRHQPAHAHADAHHNVGSRERAARVFFGAVAAGAAAAVTIPWLQALLGLLALAGIATGIGGYCPVNRALGRDSFHHPRA